MRTLAHLPYWAADGTSSPQRPNTNDSSLGLTFGSEKVTSARTRCSPKATVAGSTWKLGVLVWPTVLTAFPSTEKTVRAMPRPRTLTVKGFWAQAPGVMPGARPAIEPEGTGTLITVTCAVVGV